MFTKRGRHAAGGEKVGEGEGRKGEGERDREAEREHGKHSRNDKVKAAQTQRSIPREGRGRERGKPGSQISRKPSLSGPNRRYQSVIKEMTCV